MKAITLLALTLLSGCSLTPYQKAVLAGVGMTSLALSLRDHDSGERHVATPRVNCNANPAVCR